MTKYNKISVKVDVPFSSFYFDTLEHLKKTAEAIELLIPKEVPPDSVYIDYSEDDYWGTEVKIYYYQDETDEDFKTRVDNLKKSEKIKAKQKEEQDRKTYERLKKKFEGK